MAKKTPLQRVKDEHGGKEKLVDKLGELLERGEESKDELKKRLLAAANTKLLKLYATAQEVKERFGSRDKLVGALVEQLGRAKDHDYRTKLAERSLGRLVDMVHSAERRVKRSAAKAAATAKAAPKKPGGKKPRAA